MIEEVQNLIDQYFAWLKDKTVLKQIADEWVEVTTPHIDRHNDCLQIYVRRENGAYRIVDDGYIINDLASSGCKLDTPKREELLGMTLAGFGVERIGDVLQVRATKNDFALKKHNLLQAMLAVDDMFYLARPKATNLFYEDVVAWLDESEVRYTPKIKFAGKSGYDHMFDFVIPRSKMRPERIVQAIANPSRNTAESVVLKWVDTRNTRPANSSYFAILNDWEESVSPRVVDALENYDATPVPWSKRGKVVDELAA